MLVVRKKYLIPEMVTIAINTVKTLYLPFWFLCLLNYANLTSYVVSIFVFLVCIYVDTRTVSTVICK